MHIFKKTLSYGVVHICVATLVAYALTGNLAISIGIGLIEPIIQTIVYPIHESFWQRKLNKEQNQKNQLAEEIYS